MVVIYVKDPREKKKNGNPDETELRGRTEEGKKMAHPAKS